MRSLKTSTAQMDKERPMLAVNIGEAVEEQKKLLRVGSIWAALWKEELLDLKNW